MTDYSSNHLFAGGGGDPDGFMRAGGNPRSGYNHTPPAVATLRRNFPGMRAECQNIHTLNMRALPPARIAVGSPICKEVAPNSGTATPKPATLDDVLAETEEEEEGQEETAGEGKKVNWAMTRATAYDMLRAEEAGNGGHGYDVVCGENVPEFALRWDLFDGWANMFYLRGKILTVGSFDAAHIDGPDYDAPPQHRNRMVYAFTRKGAPRPDLRPRPRAICPRCGEVRGVQQWARPRMRKAGFYSPPNGKPLNKKTQRYRYICPNRRCGHAEVIPIVNPIRPHIDFAAPMRTVRDGKGTPGGKFVPYADTTKAKIKIGLEQFKGEPFLVMLRNHKDTVSLDEPIPVLNAEGNHHMLVVPAGDRFDDTLVRMLHNPEKAVAQGFKSDFQFEGNTAEVNRQIGNAFPPTSAAWLARNIFATLN